MATDTRARRPGGRSSRVLDSIYTAVGELVGEGAERISFPVIAERAGVNPTTLYRRWTDVGSLLDEVAVSALTRAETSLPDTGSLTGDLTAWAELIAADITRPQRVRYLRAMVAGRADLVVACPVNDDRRAQVSQLIGRAAGRSERTPTVDQVLDHVVAPLYHHVVFGLEVDDDYAARLVRDVLSMAG